MKHDDPLLDDDKLDRVIRRAFAGASEVAPRGDDDDRIDAAIARTLAARKDKKAATSAHRHRMTVYLIAAALCLGALAYAAAHRRFEGPAGETVEAAPTTAPTSIAENSTGAEALNVAPPEPPPSSPTPEVVTPDALPSVAAPSRVGSAVAPAPQPKPSTTIEPEKAALGPAELFSRANDARRASDTARAIALHEELQSKFPDSREASTSRVALGRLLLDRAGDPARARALFDRYLDRDPSGPLAEEARVGRALAFMRLGDRDAERSAWREVLERHPGSVHAERARQRLLVLGN